MAKIELLRLKNVGAKVAIDFTLNEWLAPLEIEKINEILGDILELSAKEHCQFSQFGPMLKY